MTDEQKKPLHILRLEVANIKRIKVLRLRVTDRTVLIGGKNEQGKSSAIDAIQMALGGKRMLPREPVRHGARRGDIEADLGDLETQEVEYTVERSITAKGTEVIVRGKDGVEMSSPQTLLDTLYSQIAFDPFGFSRMDADKQDALLKELVGLDFTTHNAARERAYNERTAVNKEVTRLKALLKSSEAFPKAPKKLVDVVALTEKLQAYTNEMGARKTLVAFIEHDNTIVAGMDEQIAKLERSLAELRANRQELAKDIEERTAKLPPEPAPVDDVREQLRNAETINNQVRANLERAKIEKELDEKVAQAEELTNAIDSIDAEKAELLAKAKFPIEGLGFDDAVGPTYKGAPLAQASQAAKIRVSVAIGAAINPRIKVMLIREGAFLDDDSLKLLSELADEHECQLWIERVGTGDKAAIIIEDGEIASDHAEEPHAPAA
jgi:DNA repair exonuclease SbcCD ATPase subunit